MSGKQGKPLWGTYCVEQHICPNGCVWRSFLDDHSASEVGLLISPANKSSRHAHINRFLSGVANPPGPISGEVKAPVLIAGDQARDKKMGGWFGAMDLQVSQNRIPIPAMRISVVIPGGCWWF